MSSDKNAWIYVSFRSKVLQVFRVNTKYRPNRQGSNVAPICISRPLQHVRMKASPCLSSTIFSSSSQQTSSETGEWQWDREKVFGKKTVLTA